MNHARYHVLHATAAAVVIKDVGPWDQHPTVTNDVANVIAELGTRGDLGVAGYQLPRVFCFDSEGDFDELVLDDTGHFARFAAIAKQRSKPFIIKDGFESWQLFLGDGGDEVAVLDTEKEAEALRDQLLAWASGSE